MRYFFFLLFCGIAQLITTLREKCPLLKVLNVSNCKNITEKFVTQMRVLDPHLSIYFQPSNKCCRPLDRIDK
jgi:hypothetical protein